MSSSINENIGKLAWHAECANKALQEIRALTPPAKDVRFHHTLFIVNFMSLIDLATELFGAEFHDAWVSSMAKFGGHSGENNAGYLRELRNAAIHRGVDIASSGVVISNQVCALSPPLISDRFHKKPPFMAFAETLSDIFTISHSASAPIILQFAEPSFAAIQTMDINEMRRDYLREMEASTLMPEWAKKISREAVDQLPFADIRNHYSDQLRKSLK